MANTTNQKLTRKTHDTTDRENNNNNEHSASNTSQSQIDI